MTIINYEDKEPLTYPISVESTKEGKQIARGLSHPEVRAFVKVHAALATLPNDEVRVSALRFVDVFFRARDAEKRKGSRT